VKVLHVVNAAEPRVSSGYTVRTLEIARHQRAAGLEVAIVSADFGARRRADRRTYVHETVTHHASAYPSRPGLDPRENVRTLLLQAASRIPPLSRYKPDVLVRWFIEQLERAVDLEAPHILHAHSPHACARAAIAVGRRRGLPIVYEVRGLWEASAVAEGRADRSSAWFRRERALEEEACRSASAVVTLGREMIAELERRGIPGVGLAPNGVDPVRFAPGPKDQVLLRRLGIDGVPVIGYVGSLRSIEGVDFAIEALPELEGAAMLIAGDGPDREKLERLAERIGARVVFAGRVPHDRVVDHYRLIDVFVVTRPDTDVTRTVTPLKPLEAMASGVPVLAADLPALRELVGTDRGRIYRPGDRASFVREAKALLSSAGDRARIAAEARRWVEAERTWKALAESYASLYRRLLR
jgi:glycosyltransferase involved in cell wall biosynthesis